MPKKSKPFAYDIYARKLRRVKSDTGNKNVGGCSHDDVVIRQLGSGLDGQYREAS
jgi:hypothetical protein